MRERVKERARERKREKRRERERERVAIILALTATTIPLLSLWVKLYGVATVSRIDKIIDLLCRILSLL